MVSDVGRTIISSSSLESGSTERPSFSAINFEWVTTAHSLAKPSTCFASFSKKLFGIKRGK